MNCDHCDCANQEVLMPVWVAYELELPGGRERTEHRSERWCLGCLLETRPDLFPFLEISQ